MPRLLIVEDDSAISSGLQDVFETELFDVTVAIDGAAGYTAALDSTLDCIILDIMLPFMDGLEVCRGLRTHGIGTPIVMLTSKNEEADIVRGLEIGADDYIVKPFKLNELIARVRALIRRRQALSTAPAVILAFGEVVVNFDALQASRNSKPIRMSVREFEVLKYLASREGAVVTRENLLDDVWGYDSFPTTRTIDNFILSLRKKLEQDPSNPKHILTVHTMGYRFQREAKAT